MSAKWACPGTSSAASSKHMGWATDHDETAVGADANPPGVAQMGAWPVPNGCKRRARPRPA
eukprot:15468274-Alexandrium_andersonii.AAC.2